MLKWDGDTCVHAVKNRSVEILEWAVANGCEKGTLACSGEESV